MASKIDKVNVNGTSYDIDLPSTATPSITSLTVTENLTVSGTSDLADINCTGLTCSGQATITSVNADTLTATTANIEDTLTVRKGIVGGNSGGAVCFLADSSSLNGGLFFTPLSTTTTNRTWALDNSGSDLLLGINGSVEATGDLTVSGNSNLSTITCTGIVCGGPTYIAEATAGTLTVMGPSKFVDVDCSNLQCYNLQAADGSNAHIMLSKDMCTISAARLSISLPNKKLQVGDGSSALMYTFPSTSGVLALTSDLPTKTTLTLSETTVSNSNILKAVVQYTNSSKEVWQMFSPTSSFINTYSSQLNHKLFKCVLSSLYYQDDQLKGTMEASGLIYFSKITTGDGTSGTFYG